MLLTGEVHLPDLHATEVSWLCRTGRRLWGQHQKQALLFAGSRSGMAVPVAVSKPQ